MSIDTILSRLSSDEFIDLTYCGNHYTIADLRKDLEELKNEDGNRK